MATKYCDNTYCEGESWKTVPVSVNHPGDEQRNFCIACEEVYSIGCQHGRMETRADNYPLRAFVEKIAGAWNIDNDEPIQGSDAVDWLVETVREARKLVKP